MQLDEHGLPASTKIFSPDTVKAVAALLSEVVPSDKYSVHPTGMGMGFEGLWVGVIRDDGNGEYFYFDNTFGGDDGRTDWLRIYHTFEFTCTDDESPEGKPLAGAEPLEIAKWINTVLFDHAHAKV